MTTYNWSALTNGQTLAFNPNADTMFFDDGALSASAAGILATNAAPFSVSFTFGNKTISLQTDYKSLTTTNLAFANGSLFLVGDNTTGTLNDDSANVLTGGDGDDMLSGMGGNDNLAGGAGNDQFLTRYASNSIGADTLDGGSGFDTLNYADAAPAVSVNLALNSATNAQGTLTLFSIESVFGTNSNDVLIGDNSANAFRGRQGNDVLIGGAGNDTLDGGDGKDTADYGASAAAVTVRLYANQTGDDGLGGVDTLVSIENAIGSAFNDLLYGDNNDNVFRGGAGIDQIYAGAGIDTADYSTSATGVAVDLVGLYAIDGLGGFDFLVDIENLVGSAFSDYLSGNARDNTFNGGAGNDIFVGLAGSDTIDFSSAGTGTAVDIAAQYAIDGLGGVDYFQGIENITGSRFSDYLSGDSGDNIFIGGAGSDSLVGLSGRDTADYKGAAFGVAIDLAAQYGVDGLGGTDILVSIENAVGSAFDDYLSGSTSDNVFNGGAGNDSLVGLGGNDAVDYSSAQNGVAVDLAQQYGFDGLGGIDFLVSIENVIGSALADFLGGSNADNVFKGGAGNDTFVGGTGIDAADYSGATSSVTANLATATSLDGQGGTDFMIGIENLIGSAFSDTLIGDGGANRIDGGAGNDSITGNAGADNFVFATGSGLDTIIDFTKLQGDKISLQSNLNGSGITTSEQALAHTFDFGGNAIVDVGGGSSITLLGVSTASLAATDFLIF